MIAITGCFLILAALVVVGMTTWDDRRTTVAAYTTATSNLGTAVAEQLSRSIQAVDIIMQATAEKMATRADLSEVAWRAQMSGSDMLEFLDNRNQNLPQADSLSVVDSAGMVLNTSNARMTMGTSVTGREYYKYLSTHDDHALFVNPPVRSFHDGTWTMILARRVDGRDGRFVGMVVSLLSLDYFSAFYRAITPQEGGMITLLTRDGTYLTRYPAVEGIIGMIQPASSPWYRLVAAHGGSFRSPGYATGIVQIVSVHPLQDYPLVIDAAVSESAVLADWHRRVVAESAAAAVSVACLILLLGLIAAQFRGLQESAGSLAAQHAELERAHAELEEQAVALRSAAAALGESERHLGEKSALLEMTLEQMDQGIMMINADKIVEICNRRALTLLDLPAELLARHPVFAEVLDYQLTTEGFAAAWNASAEMIHAAAALEHPLIYERRLPNGRVVEVRSVPLAGGEVIRTYTDITDRVHAEDQIRFAAAHDAVTGLLNRHALHERLRQMIGTPQGVASGLAVLFLDLDRFKLVNDTRGHEAGDKVLVEVARRLRDSLRGDDIVARLGGDEFVVVQSAVEQPAAAAALARRLVESLAEPYHIDDHSCVIGVSIGIAHHPIDGDDTETLLRNADTAMYRAKQDGRNTWRCFEAAMDISQQERLEIEADLREAIAQGQMHLAYQPICDTVSARIIGFEALLRWDHPTRGAIGPNQFIPVAEDCGLIVPLGLWALQEACARLASWASLPHLRDLRVGVNLSPLQFRQQGLPEEIARILSRTGASGSRLDIEVTERLLLDENWDVLDTMQRLKRQGMRIFLDDFGTGHAGLSYLRRFPFDKIKIDQSFIQGMATDDSARAIVQAIVTLSRSLALEVVAEGVETPQQLVMLRAMQCDQVQGFLLGRPMPPERAMAAVVEHAPARDDDQI